MHKSMLAIKTLPASHWSSAALFLLLSCSMLVKPSNYLAPLIIMAACALTWCTWRHDGQHLPREFRWFLWALCLLAASWLLDNLLSGQSLRLDKPLKIVALLPCAAYLLRYPPKTIWLWLGAAAGAIACGLFAIYQVQVLDHPRAGGDYINPIEFGDTCTQLALICLCGTQAMQQRTRHRLALLLCMLAGFTLGVTGSLLSGTRGAWLSGLMALAFLGWWYLGRHSKRLFALVLLAMCLTGVLLAQYGPVGERIRTMRNEISSYRQQGNAATSVGARVQMWQFASKLVTQRPLFGWSQKGYDNERARLLAQGHLDPYLGQFNHPHNDYLDTAAKRGIPGLLILLACHMTCLLYFWRAAKHNPQNPKHSLRQTLCAVGMLLPVLFAGFGLTDTHITSSRTVVMYFFLAACIMAMLERSRIYSAETPGTILASRTVTSP